MARLIETLILEMVKWWEAKERTAAVLERLMKWVEEMELELDGEESEKSEFGEGEEWKNEHSGLKIKMIFLEKILFFWVNLFSEFGASEDVKTQQVAKAQV